MFSFKSIVLIAMAFAIGAECSEVAVPFAAAPLTVPAHVGYAQTVPQNIAPYASQISVVNRGIAAPFAAPVATPFAAPLAAPFAAPYAARVAAPYADAPYFAGPAPLFPGAASYSLPGPVFASAPYSASAAYAAPYPYGAPVYRTPYGVAPAFVR